MLSSSKKKWIITKHNHIDEYKKLKKSEEKKVLGTIKKNAKGKWSCSSSSGNISGNNPGLINS